MNGFGRGADGKINGLVLHQNGEHPSPRLSPSQLPAGLREITLDADALAGCVGRYRGAFGVLEVALERDGLQATITGQPAFRIYANAPDSFFYKIVDAQLSCIVQLALAAH